MAFCPPLRNVTKPDRTRICSPAGQPASQRLTHPDQSSKTHTEPCQTQATQNAQNPERLGPSYEKVIFVIKRHPRSSIRTHMTPAREPKQWNWRPSGEHLGPSWEHLGGIWRACEAKWAQGGESHENHAKPLCFTVSKGASDHFA